MGSQHTAPSSDWIGNPVSQAGSLDLQSKFWTAHVTTPPANPRGRNGIRVWNLRVPVWAGKALVLKGFGALNPTPMGETPTLPCQTSVEHTAYPSANRTRASRRTTSRRARVP